MFFDEAKAIKACEEEPSLIFELIKEGHYDVVDKLLSRKKVSINVEDRAGNDVVTRLLKAKQYDLVLKYMKKKEWDVNHQNLDGNTFAHYLVSINYVAVLDIIKQLRKNKEFLPNIKNKKGETILDKSINENYIYTTLKVLEDDRFNSIDVLSFTRIIDTYIKSSAYGKYSKINNLVDILDSLDQKEGLLPTIERVVQDIRDNLDIIKKEIMKNRSRHLEYVIDNALTEAIA